MDYKTKILCYQHSLRWSNQLHSDVRPLRGSLHYDHYIYLYMQISLSSPHHHKRPPVAVSYTHL
ncbi:MAG: hypothetical protein N2200_06765, partial [Bacteroidia bacterium]|nr:hypothetical protein [Bacteroidia bacterium]